MQDILYDIEELKVQQSLAKESFDFGQGEIIPEVEPAPFQEEITLLVQQLFSNPEVEILRTTSQKDRQSAHTRKEKGPRKLRKLAEQHAPVWEKQGSGGVFIQKPAKSQRKKFEDRKAIKRLRQGLVDITSY